MAQTQIAGVIVPAEFTAYQVENSLVSTALFQSGVLVPNDEMASQLQAGAQSFTVPFWSDAGEMEADITNDDPTILSTPQKMTAAKQVVRKSFLHQSWSEMSLASELSGSDALQRVQSRVQAYWDRQWERRLIASHCSCIITRGWAFLSAMYRTACTGQEILSPVSDPGARFCMHPGCSAHLQADRLSGQFKCFF